MKNILIFCVFMTMKTNIIFRRLVLINIIINNNCYYKASLTRWVKRLSETWNGQRPRLESWPQEINPALSYNRKYITFFIRKYSGEDPQRLTCKKVPSPSSIREMSTLKLFKWLLMHHKYPQVCISYGKYGPSSPSSKREMSTLKFLTTLAGRTESPLHRLILYCMRVNYRSRG